MSDDKRLRDPLAGLDSAGARQDAVQDYAVLHHAPCGAVIASTSAAGDMLFVNHEFTTITGYSLEDVPTVTAWIELAYPDPDYRAMVLSNWAQDTSETGRDVIYEVRCKDGGTKEIQLRAALLPDQRMMVTLQDVSERLRGERERQESEERFLKLAETVDQVFWIARPDPEGIIYASPAFETIWGRPVEDLYADAGLWSRCILAQDREVVSPAWAACLRGEAPTVHFEYRIRRPDGAIRWIEDTGAAVHDHDGRVIRINGVAKDITVGKEAELALQQSEARYRALVDTMPTGVVVHVQGLVRYANQTLLQMVGIADLKQALDRPILDFIHPDNHEVTVQRLQSVEAGEVAEWFEDRLVRTNGETLEVQTSGRMIEWQGEAAFQVVVADISAIKRAEREQLRLSARVQCAQKLESLGVLAGGVAHDFNNLLVGILGNADLALLDLSPESGVRSNLEDIELAAQRAADLARQMLAYSGRGQFVIASVDLRPLVEEMTHLLEATISKKTKITYAFDDSAPTVEVDATQMRQVLMNLITNAAEAIGEGSGTITLSTGVADCDGAYLERAYMASDLSSGRYCFIEVADTGFGMDAETRDRIFDPFFSTKFTGRGLGLAAVLGIVKGHGGAVMVQSEAGRGTTFRVLLPTSDAPITHQAASHIGVQRSAQPGTVLLVDDEPIVRGVAANMLRRAGYTVITVADGRAAVATYAERADEIDCVVLDLTMPKMDGHETCRALQRVRADVRVLLSSGYSEEEAIQQFAGTKMSGFISKPYTSALLVQAVDRVLSQPG